jgi:hypothetical protein
MLSFAGIWVEPVQGHSQVGPVMGRPTISYCRHPREVLEKSEIKILFIYFLTKRKRVAERFYIIFFNIGRTIYFYIHLKMNRYHTEFITFVWLIQQQVAVEHFTIQDFFFQSKLISNLLRCSSIILDLATILLSCVRWDRVFFVPFSVFTRLIKLLDSTT